MAWFLLAFAGVVWVLTEWHDNAPVADGRWFSAKSKEWLVTTVTGIFGLLVVGSVLFTIAGLLLGF